MTALVRYALAAMLFVLALAWGFGCHLTLNVGEGVDRFIEPALVTGFALHRKLALWPFSTQHNLLPTLLALHGEMIRLLWLGYLFCHLACPHSRSRTPVMASCHEGEP